jgi:O-antigen chain-terminating methyltransferase
VAANPNAQKLAELAALVEVVKERVRTQYPETTGNGSSGTVCVGLPDLTPLARARDAAAGKMAAIGTVNPRPGGIVNNSVQAAKRVIARALNWFVRDQVLFNRQVIACIEIAIETLNDINRTIHVLAGQANTEIQKVRTEVEPLRREAQILRGKTSDFEDLVSHWNRWREEWQLKLHDNEVEFLKSVADLNTVFHQKVSYAESATQQRCAQVEAALDRLAADVASRHEQQILALNENHSRHLATVDAAFAKTSSELAASYRQIALQLEAACQDTASRMQDSFSAVVVPLEAGFRQTVANLEESYRVTLQQSEAGFRETLTQVEAGFRETLTQVEASFEKKVAGLELAYEAQIAQFDDRASRAELAFRQLADSNAEAIQSAVASQISAIAQESRDSAVALDRRMAESILELQRKFYADLDRIRTEYERVIHAELRVVRQRMSYPAAAAAAPSETPAAVPFDYARFAGRFRGTEEYVTQSQRFYLPYFKGRRHVLDIGCGRGEFLQLMREAGVPAKGIESSEESAAYCRSLDLDVEQADLFTYLSAQPEATLDGIFCSQVVEHLPPARLPEMIRLCATRLATGGILAIETPNPECLAIFATHFYLDPTHTRPIPSQLLAFYMEESGLGRLEIHPKAPAIESIPELAELPAAFREKFFGGLDYAILGYRL